MEAKFSNRVKEVISLSREEALRLGHDYIGTEHLILGMIREGEGVAVGVLKKLGVPLDELRNEIEKISKGTATHQIKNLANIPLTKASEKVLKITYLEAKIFKAQLIGTEHLLLSILRDQDNLGTQILNKFDVNYETVKEMLEYQNEGPMASQDTDDPDDDSSKIFGGGGAGTLGKIRIPLSATPLFQQRVGNVATDKPLLAVDMQDNRKVGIMLGEGLWRWRLNEFDRTDNTIGFDELFGKLIQFLSTTEDKRRFRSYPLQQEFSDTESVVFESQVYNDIFEPVYGNTIHIDLTNEAGKKTSYSYVTSPGNTRYQIGGLKEGVYRYTSSTNIGQKTETVRGEFAVTAHQVELQNLTADFDLLRKLSENTGGRFYTASQNAAIERDLLKSEAQSVIHTEESFDFLLNLKWVFLVLVLLASLEWFARKYHGSY